MTGRLIYYIPGPLLHPNPPLLRFRHRRHRLLEINTPSTSPFSTLYKSSSSPCCWWRRPLEGDSGWDGARKVHYKFRVSCCAQMLLFMCICSVYLLCPGITTHSAAISSRSIWKVKTDFMESPESFIRLINS